MSDHVTYVAGFLFHREIVLLVRKCKPEWQAGLWNAIGGRVEVGEEPRTAMFREFAEETTLVVDNWQCFCTEVGRDYTVHFFSDRLDERLPVPVVPEENDRGKELRWYSCDTPPRIVGNLNWLLPMAMDWRDIVSVVSAARSDIRERPAW